MASKKPVGDKTHLGDKDEEDPEVQTGLCGGYGGDVRQLNILWCMLN